MATHLFQKPGESVWYVRIILPPSVRHAFGGRSKLVKTTGTSNKAEAMDRRLPILARWKQEIQAAKDGKTASRDLWRPELADQGLTLEARTDASLLNAVKHSPEPLDAKVSGMLIRSVELAHRSQDPTGLTERTRDAFEIPPITLLDGVQRSALLAQDTLLLSAGHRYGLSQPELAEARDIVQSPSTYKPVSPFTTHRLELFRAYRVKDGIAAKTIDQQESKLKKLSTYLRDESQPLNRKTIATWLDTLGLSSKTKTQYLLAGSTFWRWALKHDIPWQNAYQGQDNPFSGQELPRVRGKAKADAARKAFAPEQIEQLFRVAKEGGNQALCDLIALGAHTGCRVEEIAQLRKESVVKVEGVQSFKIEDSKTVAGIREIPIHPALLATVERLIAESTDGYLLPSSGGNKYGIRSDSLSKAFGRLKTAQGYGKQHVFHSVRAMVVTLLLRGGVPGPTVANIVGHETGLVTFDVYDEGASPAQKLAALKVLTYSF
ncbi:tyrosine-type recombinase/integrase [Pseudomonas sp. D4002]|uniref:tyrosine-type recombinase/integrase n=1 Tax=unclassified Pseudomonas TaxID=196821 RepID=UPI0008129C7D|nr:MULTISPECIES: tyrosine-type recombinase/integrase [unclassified Pseudomonas]NWB22862.1 tyrosine-type recombinase/integrase [Pseudomonas sp. D4002]CRM46101.1 tyrosine recombinase XerD [Pseudomonas sp. 44 R 15]